MIVLIFFLNIQVNLIHNVKTNVNRKYIFNITRSDATVTVVNRQYYNEQKKNESEPLYFARHFFILRALACKCS